MKCDKCEYKATCEADVVCPATLNYSDKPPKKKATPSIPCEKGAFILAAVEGGAKASEASRVFRAITTGC